MNQTKWTKNMNLKPSYEVVSLEAKQIKDLVGSLLTEVCKGEVNFEVHESSCFTSNNATVSIDFNDLTESQKSELNSLGICEEASVQENTQAIFNELFGGRFNHLRLSPDELLYFVYLDKQKYKLEVETSCGLLTAEAIHCDDYPGFAINFEGEELYRGGANAVYVEFIESEKQLQTCTYDNHISADEPTHVIKHKYFALKNRKGSVVIESLPYTVDREKGFINISAPDESSVLTLRCSTVNSDDHEVFGEVIENRSQEIDEWLYSCGYFVIADFKADLQS